MKKTKRKNPKYPWLVTLSDGAKLIIPRQSQFDNQWLKKHGCSLMAEYIALQWVGINKYPIHLLRWHKEHTPDQVFKKVTVKGVAEGINKISKGKETATYYRKTTEERIKKALENGDFVIFEQKKPIHTVILLPDKDGVYMASNGKVTKVNVAKIAETALTTGKYRGMIVIKKG